MITSWGDAPASDGSPVQRLSRLPVRRRQRLAHLTGAPHSDAASLVDHLSKPEVAYDLLLGLSPDARQLARMFVEAVEPLPVGVVESEMKLRLPKAGAAQAAFDELEHAGMVVRLKWAGGAEVVGMVPPLTASARSYLWLIGDEVEPTRLVPTRPATRASVHLTDIRSLVVALAAVAADPPRLLREGDVHAADLTALVEERFGTQASEREVGAAIRRLVDLGLVAGLGTRARVVWWRAHAFFSLPPSARLPALLASDPPGRPGGGHSVRVPGLASAEHVRRLLAAALLELPAGHWARREALEGAVRMRILASDALTPYAHSSRAAHLAHQHVTRAVQAMLRSLEGSETKGPKGHKTQWLRLPVAEEGDPRAGWVVQPTHEIMVPPEVQPLKVVLLSTVADLLRSDVVATFRIDPHSAARAAHSKLEVPEVMKRLTLGTTLELPPTLAVQIEGWLRQAAAGLGPAVEPEGEAGKEVPVHLRPKVPALPKAPAPRWPRPVQRFRKEALSAPD